jgi:hypothetical protein
MMLQAGIRRSLFRVEPVQCRAGFPYPGFLAQCGKLRFLIIELFCAAQHLVDRIRMPVAIFLARVM